MGKSAATAEAPVELGIEKTKPLERVARPTEELIIGMVGAVGAGVSKTAVLLKDKLSNDFGYNVEIIRASSIIRENAGKTISPNPAESGSDRIRDLQLTGTELRKKFGEEYIAAKAIEKIALSRAKDGYDDGTIVPQPKSLRNVTIIDSLKHQDETKLLRDVYGGIYWQFTVFAPEEVREDRLKDLGIGKEDLVGIFTTDENDVEDHGQQVSKTAYLSDFFIRNDEPNEDRLKEVIDRFLEIIFNITVHTPTTAEAGMYAAVSAASKSACLSRQVGAAIYSNENELVSVGWNDVPKSLGGLYTEDDFKADYRCFKWGKKICHNDGKKEELYEKIFSQLKNLNLLKDDTDAKQIRAALTKTPVKNLIEYSRSIHAEMEAIVSAARTGKSGIVGGTLYTTTFPCHNCARHIVASGISKVYYVEPYAKSLALDLHKDAIGVKFGDENKVLFLQYEGVGPGSILKLFNHGAERKENGRVNEIDKKVAIPILPPPMDGFTTHEKRVITRLENAEAESFDENPG